MSDILKDIVITCDTREKNVKRTKAVWDWGKSHGAILEWDALKLCDYRLMGDFRGHDINVGVEAKGLSDFCSCDYEDLKRKLFDSFEIYDEVALFIESANYSFLNEGFGKSAIINSAVRDGSANVCNLAVLEGCCSTLPMYGIHIRQLRSESQFPYTIENLLTYIIHDHDIIKTPKQYLRAYQHTLKSFMTATQVKKALSCYPNLFWLASASEDSYKEIFGAKTGNKLYEFIRDHSLETPEWKKGKFHDGTDKITLPEPEVCDKIKGAIVDYLTEECPHALTVDELCDHFNIEQGDVDKEVFLIYLKELAWEKKITNITSGEFTIISQHSSHTDTESSTSIPPLKTIIHSVSDDRGRSNTATTLSHASTEHLGSNPESGRINKALGAMSSESKLGTHDCQQKVLPPSIIPSADNSKSNIVMCVKCGFQLNPVQVENCHKRKTEMICDDCEWEAGTYKMSARKQLEIYLQQPHTLQECVDAHSNFTKGVIWEHIARMKKEGVIIEFDNKTLVMTK